MSALSGAPARFVIDGSQPEACGAYRCPAKNRRLKLKVERRLVVEDALEEEARRWRGESRGQIRRPTREVARRRRRQVSVSDLDEHADEPAHHLPEKMRSDDAEEHEVAVRRDRRPARTRTRVDFSSGSSSVNARKSREPENAVAGRAHGARRRAASRTHQTNGLAKAVRRRRDLVEVASRDGAVARVKARGHALGGQDVDVVRQRVVDARDERGRRQLDAEIDVRDLAERVHAGIGAAGAVRLERRAARRLSASGAVELALHRARVLLDLPAAVAGAGVFERQLVAGHRGRSAS